MALSGGVDSAVAALREREAGREVVAVTLKLWADQRTDGERSCCSPEAVLGARRVAHSLGIPHLTLDLENEFRAGVVDPFLRGYAEGRTPNPCVLCNGELRIDAMIALADRLGARRLATGHYARIVDDGDGPLLSAAADAAKDQTYMLSGLRPGSLARLRFPLARAHQAGGARNRRRAPVSRSPAGRTARTCASSPARASASSCAGTPASESVRATLWTAAVGASARTTATTTSPSVSAGAWAWAAASRATSSGPTPTTNTVVAGTREDLATRRVRIGGARLHRPAERVDGVRLRSHSPKRECRLEVDGDPSEATVALAEPVDGAAPGQVACLLDGDLVVGHGVTHLSRPGATRPSLDSAS